VTSENRERPTRRKGSLPLGHFPHRSYAAENAQIQEGDTVAVWGAGPVGQFAIASAFMLGAARVIAIDRIPERLALARSVGAITVDYSGKEVSVLNALNDLTGGVGPDACIDAVGLEAHMGDLQGLYDTVKVSLMLETDRSGVLRQAIQAVRKGGTLSIPGVYGGLLDKVPFGAAFGKGITMKMGQTNIQLHEALVGACGEGTDRPQLHHIAPHHTG
jgi:threonine dehydrogenase-like Zn-dependent dehydrogenase